MIFSDLGSLMFPLRFMATFPSPLSMKQLIWDRYPALLDSIFHHNLTDAKKADWSSAILQTRCQIKALHQTGHVHPCASIDCCMMMAIMSLNQHSLNILPH